MVLSTILCVGAQAAIQPSVVDQTIQTLTSKNAGDKAGIERYGDTWVPMDEALTQVVIDLSGRPFLVFKGEFQIQLLGNFETELVEDFFQALAFTAKMNLHIRNEYGRNTHHIIESMFKATGRALRKAVTINPEIEGVNSTKGVI